MSVDNFSRQHHPRLSLRPRRFPLEPMGCNCDRNPRLLQSSLQPHNLSTTLEQNGPCRVCVGQVHDEVQLLPQGQGLVRHEIDPVGTEIAGEPLSLLQLYENFTTETFGSPPLAKIHDSSLSRGQSVRAAVHVPTVRAFHSIRESCVI